MPAVADHDLTPLEKAMVSSAARGETLSGGPVEPGIEFSAMMAWGADRTVRALVLRHLLVFPSWSVEGKGVELHGVRISGQLNLTSSRLRCPLVLVGCLVESPEDDEPIALDHATASRIAMRNCHLPGINAERLALRGTLDVSGSSLRGPLNLSAASIEGSLNCRRVKLLSVGNTGRSLSGDGLKTGGSVFLSAEFEAAGAITLYGARIGGQFACNDARISGADKAGWSLQADRLEVGRSLLAENLRTSGGVTLKGASVTGQLKCKGAQLDGTDPSGRSLVADRIRIADSAFLNGNFMCRGSIRLPGATIGGQLNLKGARVCGVDPEGRSVVADHMRVGDDVLLVDGFSSEGEVNVSASNIEGSLRIKDAQLGQRLALDAQGLHVTRDLVWRPGAGVQGTVDLQRATVDYLLDDPSSLEADWPPRGKLRLEGFQYQGFGEKDSGTYKRRLDWVRLQYEPVEPNSSRAVFAAQPYEQLARVYRNHGRSEDANRVSIAALNDLRHYGQVSHTARLGSVLLNVTIGHGYKPFRAAFALFLLYLATFAMFLMAQHAGGPRTTDALIVPAKDVSQLESRPTALDGTDDYPVFYPAALAFDTVVPLVSTRQAENWRVNGDASYGSLLTGLTVGMTILGWSLSTLVVVGYTGLIRRV